MQEGFVYRKNDNKRRQAAIRNIMYNYIISLGIEMTDEIHESVKKIMRSYGKICENNWKRQYLKIVEAKKAHAVKKKKRIYKLKK